MIPINNYKIRWNTIYSLGLAPLIAVWILIPFTEEYIVAFILMIVGGIWLSLSRTLIYTAQGCGLISWAASYGMIGSGACKTILFYMGIDNSPTILPLAPIIAVLLFLYKNHNQRPYFCQKCVILRGCAQERMLLGDFSRYEARYIASIVLTGSIALTLLTWVALALGVEQASRTGRFIYYYTPLILAIATIFFETIRHSLIYFLIKNRNNEEDGPDKDQLEICYTIIRLIVICQGKIFLLETKATSHDTPKEEIGFDTPILQHLEFTPHLDVEKKLAREAVLTQLGIENPNLHHFSSTTSPAALRRVGQYLLFLPPEEMSRLDSKNGKWLSTEEINQLYRNDRLLPIFKEFYARLHTIVTTALTYHINGKRRHAIKNYTPTFSLHDIEKLDIEFDDPTWVYVNRYNEDKFIYRLIQKLRNKCCCCHKKNRHD